MNKMVRYFKIAVLLQIRLIIIFKKKTNILKRISLCSIFYDLSRLNLIEYFILNISHEAKQMNIC